MPIICPQCNKDDMIQKVKAVYSGGVSSGQYSGTSVGIGISTKDGTPTVVSGNTNIAGTSQTLLSRRLSPPPQPSIMGNLRPPIIAVLVLVMVVDCAIVFQTGMLYGSMNNGTSMITLLFVSFSLAGLLISLLYKGEKPIFEATQTRWKILINKWDNLYYCARDDCVFDPASGKSVPADNISALLEEPLPDKNNA